MAWGVDIRESRTIASSEQEAASKLVLIPETVSRCLLSLTQALGAHNACPPSWPLSALLSFWARWCL